jgi:LPXTG-motif cell wall-anchored protein
MKTITTLAAIASLMLALAVPAFAQTPPADGVAPEGSPCPLGLTPAEEEKCISQAVAGEVPDALKEAAASSTASASVAADSQYAASASAGSDASGDGTSSASASATPEATVTTLPETGGASLLAVGAGVLLVAGGLLARRVVRS